jgi:DNA-binding CsgD family transcriptional regulator
MNTHLTAREVQVVRLLAAGQRNGQVAQELGISPKTTSTYMARAAAKLGADGKGKATILEAFRKHIDQLTAPPRDPLDAATEPAVPSAAGVSGAG